MKKLLIFVLSIMFIAGAFTTAYADDGEVVAKVVGSKIILGGDMRVRGVCKINHDADDDADDDNCYWDQRARLVVTGQVGDAEVRIRLKTGEGMWNDAENTGNVTVDYAYLHIPVAGIVIDAGRQKATFGNKFYQDDVAVDRFKVSAKVGDATVGAYSDKRAEHNGPDGFLDNDVDDYGIFAVYNAGDVEGGVLVVFRNDDVADDNDGTDASVYVKTTAAGLGVKGELSMKTDDYNYETADEDTQWGGFVSAEMGMDAVTVGGLVAFSANGFVADSHFTPTVLLGLANPGTMENFGVRGDSILGVLSVAFQATPELSVYGKAAYADYESYQVGDLCMEDCNSTEVDAGLKYQISKGVTYTADLGYLLPDDYSVADDSVLTVVSKFHVNFN